MKKALFFCDAFPAHRSLFFHGVKVSFPHCGYHLTLILPLTAPQLSANCHSLILKHFISCQVRLSAASVTDVVLCLDF